MANMFPTEGFWTLFYPCLKHGFSWFLASSQMSSSQSGFPWISWIQYRSRSPLRIFALLFFHGICYSLSCYMLICLFICVCVSLHLPFVFSFVKIGDLEPTDLTCRRYSINIVEWTNRNVDILYLLVEIVVNNEKRSFSSSICWERKDKSYGFSV